MPSPTTDPQHLDVERHLDTLSFTLTDWSAALWRSLGGVSALIALGVAGAAVTGGAEALEALEAVPLVIPMFTIFALIVVGRSLRIHVTIDSFGASIVGRHREDRYHWSDFERVERRGRRLFLDGPRGRVELPTPTAYTDAAWMERVVREGVEAIGTEADALPEGLQALRGVEAERR